jgi:Mrp family chromosome partitioning ATPase
MASEVLLITGAAGVGKSSVSWEVSEELKRRGLAHAVIDTDELDRVWPLELHDTRRRRLNIANLTAWWEQYRELGISRLVLVGVFVKLTDAIDWIGVAIPDADIRAVRLVASPRELGRRVEQREVGSAQDEQVERALQQANEIESLATTDEVVFDTDGVTVASLAVWLCDLMAWTP